MSTVDVLGITAVVLVMILVFILSMAFGVCWVVKYFSESESNTRAYRKGFDKLYDRIQYQLVRGDDALTVKERAKVKTWLDSFVNRKDPTYNNG